MKNAHRVRERGGGYVHVHVHVLLCYSMNIPLSCFRQDYTVDLTNITMMMITLTIHDDSHYSLCECACIHNMYSTRGCVSVIR